VVTELTAELLASMGGVRVRVGGRSMWPFLPHGSVVDLRRVEARDLRAGAVVLVRAGGHDYRLHRIVERDGAGRVRLRGDSRGVDDGWFPAADVLGRVAAVRLPGAAGRLALRGWRLAALDRLALVVSRWRERARPRVGS